MQQKSSQNIICKCEGDKCHLCHVTHQDELAMKYSKQEDLLEQKSKLLLANLRSNTGINAEFWITIPAIG